LHPIDGGCNVWGMPAPSPRSLILELLSTLRGESMPVGALVAAGALFGIPEGGLRVALTRLFASRAVARDERGRYRLGPAAAALDQRVVAWRRLEEHVRRWEGGWLGVHRRRLARGRARAAGERALRLLGFARLAPDLALRPDNLRAGVTGVREQLVALGLEPEALVFALSELDPASEARARGLWDVAALRRGYARSRRELAAGEARLARLSEPAAMRESFRLGGRVIRELVHDPLLPEALVPADERRAVAAALRRYDRAGRRAWAAFLARHGAPHVALALPTDGALAVANA
jgi:phenylacetic acid degradation operon negative regulatory protein